MSNLEIGTVLANALVMIEEQGHGCIEICGNEGGFAERFIACLNQCETTRNIDPLVDLFADETEVQTLMMPHPERGKEAARRFWSTYLKSFRSIESQFTRITQKGNIAILEWVSRGTRIGGEPLRYRGVTILESNKDDQISLFHSYFDSAALLNLHHDKGMHSPKNPEKTVA